MRSNYDEYLLNLLDFSEEVKGVNVKFVDKNIENFYIKANFEDDFKKSKSFTILINSIYIV